MEWDYNFKRSASFSSGVGGVFDRIGKGVEDFKYSFGASDYVSVFTAALRMLISPLRGIISLFQIEDASDDIVTRTFALLSMISALMSLIFGCTFIVRFSTMKGIHKAIRWAEVIMHFIALQISWLTLETVHAIITHRFYILERLGSPGDSCNMASIQYNIILYRHPSLRMDNWNKSQEWTSKPRDSSGTTDCDHRRLLLWCRCLLRSDTDFQIMERWESLCYKSKRSFYTVSRQRWSRTWLYEKRYRTAW